MFTKKVIISLSAVATVLAIISGIWAFEAHYATNQRVDNVAYASDKNVEQLEIQVASALQNQQYKSDIRYFTFLYEKLTQDMYTLKRMIEQDPNNELLKQDYNEIVGRRIQVKDKLDKALERIE